MEAIIRWREPIRLIRERRRNAFARPPVKLAYAFAKQRDWLLNAFWWPDVTLRPLFVELAPNGIKVSYHAVGYFFERQGISLKVLHASE